VLHQAGADVLATARRAGLLDQLAGECGERIEVMPGDITDASRRQALAGRLAGHGRRDVLVNNAGICNDGPIEQQSLSPHGRCGRCEAQPMRSASETMIPSGPRT
jgi:NAD(P)-dependent dehydrogenase (short-subunit alcohol dehydrogenase family)